jgi:sulfoxide reductase heme-binding subunit YedZ
MAWHPTPTQWFVLHRLVFLLVCLPMMRLVLLAYRDALGANPIEALTRATGWWSLVFLLVTLLVTPLRRVLQWPWLLRMRRTLGLSAFFYALAHFITFIWFDHWFDWMAMFTDVIKRPFITMGFSAFVVLLPLALTSNNYMTRKLGAQRWQRLHRLAYLAPVIAVIHYWWLVKADVREPLYFAIVLALLLVWRVWYLIRQLSK